MALGSAQNYTITVNGPNAPATLKRPTNKQDAPPRPTKVPRTDANASSLRKTGLQSATQLVINGSKVSGLYALRLSGAKSWLCSEFQFVDKVVGSGFFPRAVEMKMLGMKQDQQRTIRVSANDILEWMELHGHTVSSDSTMVFDIIIHDVAMDSR
ncbi:hypothetical protein FB107DRAFT_279746 [Schizophyllum commune]